MRLPRQDQDERPFATEGSAAADVSRLVAGEYAAQLTDAGVKNRFRIGVEHWASQRGLPIVDSMIVVAVDGVTARVPLYEITEATGVVRGAALQPAKMSLVIEPTSWTQRVRARFGAAAFATGDGGFDRQWSVTTSDAGAAHQLLDEECREVLRDVGCWCRATYADGAIEVRLDADKIAGAHVLGGIEIVLLLARLRIHTTAYR